MAFELDATFRTADGASRWLRRSAGRAGTARSATHGTMILKHRQSALMDRCVKPAREYIILAWRCQTSYACEGLSTVRRTDQGSSDWTRASPAHRTRGPRYGQSVPTAWDGMSWGSSIASSDKQNRDSQPDWAIPVLNWRHKIRCRGYSGRLG